MFLGCNPCNEHVGIACFGNCTFKKYGKDTIPTLSPGKDWFVYVQEHVADVIASALQGQRFVQSTRLKDTLADINYLSVWKNPCPSIHIDLEWKVYFDSVTREGISSTKGFQTMPTICGSVVKTYGINSPNRNIFNEDALV